jgi:hypothetical protein
MRIDYLTAHPSSPSFLYSILSSATSNINPDDDDDAANIESDASTDALNDKTLILSPQYTTRAIQKIKKMSNQKTTHVITYIKLINTPLTYSTSPN